MRGALAMLAGVLLSLLGSGHGSATGAAFEPGGFPDQLGPRGLISASESEFKRFKDTDFELPLTRGQQAHRVHYLGFCGSLRKELWHGGNWIALAVLANIALDQESFMTKFPRLSAHPAKRGEVRWLFGTGITDEEEVEHAVRLMRGSWKDSHWLRPADVLIGCGSRTTTKAVASEATAARTPLISPTPFTNLGQVDHEGFPYFFRATPPNSVMVTGFLQVCKHFGWTQVGLLYDEALGQMESLAQVVQSKAIDYPEIVGFRLYDSDNIQTIRNLTSSPLRVFGLAASSSPRTEVILQVAADFGLLDRLWIAFDTAIFSAMSTFERQAWSGMLVLDANDLSCCTPLAAPLEATWHSMSFQTLLDHHVPEPIVKQMQKEAPDLFQRSPWHARGAFFFDAILMALLAFKIDDENSASARLSHSPGQSVSGILQSIRLDGVSGFMNQTQSLDEHQDVGGWHHASLALKQLRSGKLVTVGGMVPEVVITNEVIFPNGGSDPHTYDYNGHQVQDRLPTRPVLPQEQLDSHDKTFFVHIAQGLKPGHKVPERDLRLGLCGNMQHDSWQGSHWPALLALVKIALEDGKFTDKFPFLNKSFVAELIVAVGNTDDDEVEQAASLLTGAFEHVSWKTPVRGLIGCSSSTTTEAVAGVASAMGKPMMSSTASSDALSDRDRFPNFFRTVPADGDIAHAFVRVCIHFSWTDVGFIHDGATDLWDAVMSIQHQTTGAPSIKGFLIAIEQEVASLQARLLGKSAGYEAQLPDASKTLAEAMNSGLRVFGVAEQPSSRRRASDMQNVLELLYMSTEGAFDEKLFIFLSGAELTFADVSENAVMPKNIRSSFNGMMVLDFGDNSCCSDLSQGFQAIWHTLTWKDLLHAGIPEKVLNLLMETHPSLFNYSPWQAGGAFFVDAVLAMLLGFSVHEPTWVSGISVGPTNAIEGLSFHGVAGLQSFAKGKQPRIVLQQIRNSSLITVGRVHPTELVLIGPVLFPNDMEASVYNAEEEVIDSEAAHRVGDSVEVVKPWEMKPDGPSSSSSGAALGFAPMVKLSPASTNFVLSGAPKAQGQQHVIGFCGKMQHGSWQDDRWPALVVLAKLATARLDADLLGSDALRKVPVIWQFALGNDDNEEVSQAARLLSGGWVAKRWWQPPVEVLIGCSSAKTVEAVADVANAMGVPLVSSNAILSNRLGDKERYPNFFRAVPSDAGLFRSFIEVCKYFTWEHVGFIFDGSMLLWEAMDKLRQQTSDAPKIDWFQPSTLSEAAAASHLRVFGVASEHAAAGNTLLREINNRVVQGLERQFVLLFPDAFLGLVETGSTLEISRGWEGTMILDFSHQYSEKSLPGAFQAHAEAIWQNMSFKTLLDDNIPSEVVEMMRKSHPDLFTQSPWLSRGAFFVDGIVSALMAVQINALDRGPKSGVANAMRHTKIFEASRGDGEPAGNLRHPRFALWQVQQGNLTSIGSFQPNLTLSKAPIFPGRSAPQVSHEFRHGLPNSDQGIRTRRAHLPETPVLPSGLARHVQGTAYRQETSGQDRDYNTVQFHTSRHGLRKQRWPAHEDISAGTIKLLIGVSVVLIVCISLPSRQEFSSWARTLVLDMRPRGPLQHDQEARHLRTAQHNEDEAVGETTE